jgi:integrase
MKAHLTERLIKTIQPDASGRNLIVYDDELTGFGVRVTAAGHRSFVFNFFVGRRERRITIGSSPEWSVAAAREEAKRLRREIDSGRDPLAAREEARNAPTMKELAQRYLNEHASKLAPRNYADQKSIFDKLVLPEIGAMTVAAVTAEDIDRLLAKIAKGRARPRKAVRKGKDHRGRTPKPISRPTPIRANRVGEMLRKVFNLAIRWKMRLDNPAVGFARHPEVPRDRYLTADEIGRLSAVLAEHPNRRCADIIRLILLTGARRGEAMNAHWDQFDLDNGIWTKPAATTKQRRLHRAPLSRAAVSLLQALRAQVPDDCPWVFPGEKKGNPLREMQSFWEGVRAKADLPGVRIHDLRHTFASLLVSGGMTLPMIGKLLGHTQVQTTARYAHLFDDPLREGLDQVGDMLRPKLRLSEPKPESNPLAA